MAISTLKGATVDVRLWAPIHEVESDALTQLRNIASLPWVRHVCAMPDVHLGKGATVGSVIAMKNALAPSAVGVDIGCGMSAVKTNLKAADLPDNLSALRSEIEATIPSGNGPNGGHESAKASNPQLWEEFKTLHADVDEFLGTARKQVGTLGGGNHFIELCLDQDDSVWMMLHSGSRRIGGAIAERHIKIAKTLEHNARLPDPDLAVFLAGTKEMVAYRNDLYWAQFYARENRHVMLRLYRQVMDEFFGTRGVKYEQPISCHHNYVAEEEHFGEELFVTRKGAIRADKGDLGIIPGSMGTRSYIVRGLGSDEALRSASHGAGRRMSRNAAKKHFTLEDLAEQTKGVECRKDHGVLDEIPGAYKDIDTVMANQKDLVEVVAELRAVLCVKGV